MTPQVDKNIIGAIAIQKDGHVGYVMDLKAGFVVIDGEDVRPDDMRALRVGDGNIAIMNYAAELGHDVEAQKAIIEAVRLLRTKTFGGTEAPSEASVELDTTVEEAIAQVVVQIEELDTRTMSYKGKRVRLADGTTGAVEAEDGNFLHVLLDGMVSATVVHKKHLMSVINDAAADVQPSNLLATIESLRAEVKILEREIVKKNSTNAGLEAKITMLERDLELEQKARRLAESINNLTPSQLTASPSPLPQSVGVGEQKPYGAKIISDTTEERCELLWEDNWELMHSQFSPDGKLQTLWRKINDYQRPDGSPLRESVALPQIADFVMEETDSIAPVMTLEEVDAVLYGSVNKIPTPTPSPLHEEGSATAIIEIAPADTFPRFDGDIVPIKTALRRFGYDKVNAAFNRMDEIAGAQAAANSAGMALANRPITQFGTPEVEKI